MGDRSLNPAIANVVAAAISLLTAKASLAAAASELPDDHHAQREIVEALYQLESAIAKVEQGYVKVGPGGTEAKRNEYNPRHPHEPAIPPAFDSEGRCLVCVLLEAEREALSMILKADHGDWDRTVPTLAQWAEARLRELGQ